MKKVLLALFTLALCFSSLFANEASVKQAILRDAKFASEGRFIECVKYHTKDFVATESGYSTKVTYEDSVIMAKMMDGKHPLEFLFFVFKMQMRRYPNAQEAEKLRAQTKNAQILQEYKNFADGNLMLTILVNTVSYNAVADAGAFSVVAGHTVTDLGVDRVIVIKQIVADRTVQQRKGIAEIFLDGFVKHSKTGETVYIDGDLACLPGTKDQIPIHMIQIPGEIFAYQCF